MISRCYPADKVSLDDHVILPRLWTKLSPIGLNSRAQLYFRTNVCNCIPRFHFWPVADIFEGLYLPYVKMTWLPRVAQYNIQGQKMCTCTGSLSRNYHHWYGLAIYTCYHLCVQKCPKCSIHLMVVQRSEKLAQKPCWSFQEWQWGEYTPREN